MLTEQALHPHISDSLTLHASAAVIGDAGLLIRGASGAGKSRLARTVIELAAARGLFAAWIGDDRVRVARAGGRLVCAPHPVIAGRFEARGLGILAAANEPKAVLRLVADLVPLPERMPESAERTTSVAGIALPRLALVAASAGLYEASLIVTLLCDIDGKGAPDLLSRGRGVGYLTGAR